MKASSIMTEDKQQRKSRISAASLEKLQIDSRHTKREPGRLRTEEIKEEYTSSNGQSPRDMSTKASPESPFRHDKASHSPSTDYEEHEEVISGEVTVKQEPGQPPKLSRSTSQKFVAKPPRLFDDCDDKTREARGSFQVIPECSYSSKYIGSTEHDSMDCDCAEEWGKIIFTVPSSWTSSRH